MTAFEDAGWVRTWGTSPQVTDAAFADVTLRQELRVSGGGRRVRVRLSNEHGIEPLTIGAARLGLAGPGGGVQAGTDRELTFGGRAAATVPAGAPLVSDPVDLPLADLTRLSIDLYLPGKVAACTGHDMPLDVGWAIPGNAVAAPALPPHAAPLTARALISAVEVLAGGSARTVVALGDSRVDGAGSTVGAARSWPDRLAERGLYVSNQGISGNRLLNDGLGASGLARFDRDVLATPGLGCVVVSIGANDLAISFAPRDDGPLADFLAMFPGAPVTADDVIAGLRQLIARAHDRGVAIHAATIAPYEGHDIYTPEGDAARRAVNDWIRTGGEFDAVLDFDAVWRDPARPRRIRDDLHAGDHLHGNDAGYRALADSIDVSLFG
ncbi:SGNH/GDSL hydrolase family protein [Couchioplanes caeruleus]|uniref:SGNH/GDSL hydrolase family protein n=1 Tax=Couchioplanes caeruleus TaxID=56438 RepID=UPI0020BF23C6|nr:SGNH/GDSL hydrolase family protein [Couchioplanes caeruleus]UQU62716.1 SGNH/GDSL hydrolase family protein [Couchioplanes caeruleus]